MTCQRIIGSSHICDRPAASLQRWYTAYGHEQRYLCEACTCVCSAQATAHRLECVFIPLEVPA